jgi:protein arginine N-methyltransferase 1
MTHGSADADGRGWVLVETGDACVEVRIDASTSLAASRLWPSVGEYPVYDDFLYDVMLQDEARNALFERAIAEQARGRVVVELGSGPDLLWASVAAKSGARRVLAVEVSEPVAREARRRAELLGTHVEVIHGDAMEVSLPVRGDMCIAEMVGAIGGAEGIAVAIADARRRHLEPGAVVVPHRVRTRIAGLGAADLLGGPPAVHPDVVPYVEAVMRSAGSAFDLRMCLTGLSAADLLTTTDVLEDLELDVGIQRHATQVRLDVTRPGALDSGVLWLDLQCAPGHDVLDSMATVSNWLPVLLPFDLERAVAVEPGDVLALDVTRRVPDGLHPEWTFDGAITRPDGSATAIRGASAYAGGPLRRSWLHRALLREAGTHPARSSAGL